MPDPSDPIRDTVRGAVRDAQEAARESSRAASAAGNDIRADVELLRSDVAHYRHETEQGIDTEADARAGDGEQRIHQLGNGSDARHGGFDLGTLEPLDALESAGGARGGMGFRVGH